MKRKNLDLASELGEDIDVTEDQANEAREIVVAPIAAAPVAPVGPIALTLEQIQALMASATAGSAANNAALAESITQGIAQARKPIPEGTDQSNPRISVFNPLGDRDHVRPKLKCEFFLGTQDESTEQVHRTYPFEDGDLTVHEVIALNTLQPGNATIRLHDGAEIHLSIVAEKDKASGALRRMVLVVPATVIGKGSAMKNMLPGLCNIVSQVMGGADYNRLSKDDLAWFMAEHVKKNYVAERSQVAA